MSFIRPKNFIRFLGTAGARFVMIKQFRSSAGIWIRYDSTDIIIDPGPGSLVHCAQSRPRLDPTGLSGIILTHRHLDHANDVNVMIEAMTEGGFKKRGSVFVPGDALADDPVILRYAQSMAGQITILQEGKEYQSGTINFSVPVRMVHPVETYGLRFAFARQTVSLIADTEYFEGIERYYKADIVIINVVFFERRSGVQHLNLEDATKIIRAIRPKKAILTHFGLSMLKAEPERIARALTKKLGVAVIAARDGMVLPLEPFLLPKLQ